MNRLFKFGVMADKVWYRHMTTQYLSNQGAQATIFKDLKAQEKERETLFARELAERETEDILDHALLKAEHAKLNGVLPAHEYHKIAEKVAALKKLRFVEGYEKLQDHQTYEWIKYKTAAEIGGEKEQEAFALYEKIKIDQMGEVKYRLLKESAPKIM